MSGMRSALVLAAVASSLAAEAATAQLPSASASALGMAGNNTAFVRGFGAIAVNPAGLGMPGSGFSLAIVPAQVRLGLQPVTLGDLADFEGRLVPRTVKEQWLDLVTTEGGEVGTVGADASLIALTIGNVGFQISSTASATVNLPPGVVEALLYGNAGRTESPTDLSLVGGAISTFAMSTAAMSFALSLNERVAVGLTGKYTYGHGLLIGESRSGALEADPIRGQMEFPLIASCEEELECTQDFVNGGTGFGLDLGAMMDLGTITVGATIENILSSFAWDETKLGYRPGTVTFEDGDFESVYDELAFDDAPEELKSRVADFTPEPAIRVGAALDVSPNLTVTGDIHGRLADGGIALQPGYHTGVGAELRLGFLHLRGGLAKISDGFQYGAGTSLVLGPVNLSGAVGFTQGELSDTSVVQLGLSFGNR